MVSSNLRSLSTSDLWRYNSIFRICCVLFNIRRGTPLVSSRSQDGDYPSIAVQEGRRLMTFSDIVDEFVMNPPHEPLSGQQTEGIDVTEEWRAEERRKLRKLKSKCGDSGITYPKRRSYIIYDSNRRPFEFEPCSNTTSKPNFC